MRAVWITKHGDGSVLEVRETPDPSPRPGEVKIRAHACGLNFAELSARQGLYPDAPKPPCVVGYEGAGQVLELGEGVSGLEPGQRVVYMVRFGGHSDTVCAPQHQVLPMPEDMSFEQAAAIPVNYLTAYHMLHELRRIRPGEHVLVHMAAGGVGTAALQLCRAVGEVTTYGTASAGKHEYLREHGCTHPIDYRTQDYQKEIMRLTGGRGVDVVLDALGGADWRKGYSLLKPCGTLIGFGLANSNTGGKRNLFNVGKQLLSVPRWGMLGLMDKNLSVSGCNMGHLWGEQELMRRELDAILELWRQGAVRPHVDSSYPFSRAREAFEQLEFGKNRGKVLLLPD